MRIKNNAKFCIPQQQPHIKMWSNLKEKQEKSEEKIDIENVEKIKV